MVPILLIVCFLSNSLTTAHAYKELIKELDSCRKAQPLGMISGGIHDNQITSSSVYPREWDGFCDEKYARPYMQDGKSWCAKYQSASEWIQVDLGVPSKVVGVMTQGRCRGDEWVSSFSVSYSMHGSEWNYVLDNDHNHRIFEGNVDSCTAKHSYIDVAILSRYIKIHVVTWNRHPSMRVELIGCQVFVDHIVFPPYSRITASTSRRVKDSTTCQPHNAYLVSNKAWCPRTSNKRQWIQVDIGPPSLVVAVVTKGKGDTKRKYWVTMFGLSFSNTTSKWNGFMDRSKPDSDYIFEGNKNKGSVMVNYLNQPITARYLRLHPITWHGHIAMRVGLLGSLYQGECTSGFMRINEHSPCVENLAYNKSSWINNKSVQRKRHARHHWTRAVPLTPAIPIKVFQSSSNSSQSSKSPSCVILDNFSVERPIWLVDLQKRSRVSGLVIKTPMVVASTNEDKYKFRDYMHDLDKLVIYLDDHKAKDRINRPEMICGILTTSSGTLFQPRIHVPCRKPMKSRYVYIEAWGLEKRHGRLFSATLCDVEIYE